MTVHYHSGGFPPGELRWAELIPLLGRAHAAVARYDGVLHGIPNPNVLLSPLTVLEAVLSSRIEGIHATLGEVLEFEAEGDRTDESTLHKADVREILNYRAALHEALRLSDELPLSERLIRATHAVLMQGARGRNKSPGAYRRIPNWIGPAGCSLDQARFVPCSVDGLAEAMRVWEAFIHADAADELVQLAILHAEFEAIHPFLDGNGRLGRLLVPLFLNEKGMVSMPNFYLSEYLEQNRNEYYERLLTVSRDGDWTGWCAFFLRGIVHQAESGQARVRAIHALYDRRKEWMVEATGSRYGGRALDWFFSRPIFSAADFVANVEIHASTAKRILRKARDQGMLREIRASSGRRAGVLAFPELLNICEGRAAP